MKETYFSKFTESTDLSSFDHIIIGSGIGGLTLATWLAKGGLKVAVLEQHYVPGGFTHVFSRGKNFKFDVGVHYVGNVGEDGSVRDFFDFITDKELKWANIGDTYDVVRLGTDKYELKAGKENFRAQMHAYFPDDKLAIDKYIQWIEIASKKGNMFFFEKIFKPWLSYSLGSIFRYRYMKFAKRTTLDVLKELTDNKRLISVLSAQMGNYGLSPKYSSFAVHSIIVNHYMKGGYYPIGGVENVSHKICKTLSRNGGKVFTQAEVSKIEIKNKRVQGIHVNGRFINCKSVISNTGVRNTFGSLLSEKERKLTGYNLEEVKSSVGHLCLYIGLNKSASELELPKHNIWFYDNEQYIEEFDDINLDSSAKKFSYISFPSAKDPDWDKEHEGTATIQIITMSYYDWFKEYENEPFNKRSEKYLELKESLQKDMLERLFNLYPQVKDHIELVELSTPLTTKHFSKYQDGEIYGLEHTPKRFTLSFLRFETKIKGLRLVGQDITLVGLTGAMLSGLLCATNILKFKCWSLFKDIMSKPDKDR